jgi:hypothetical protein
MLNLMKLRIVMLALVSAGVPIAVGCRDQTVSVDVATVTSASVMTLAQCQSLWDDGEHTLRAFDDAHRACTAPSQCVTAHAGWCLAACDTAVQASAVGPRATLVSSLQQKCTKWTSACGTIMPVSVPTCPMYVAACTSGSCIALQK